MQKTGIRLEGFSRVHLRDPDGKLVGDSGWTGPNMVTNTGFQEYLCKAIINTETHYDCGYIALGTGTAPGAANTNLAGEVEKRSTGITPTVESSKTAQFCATFNSGMSFVSTTMSLSNIGLFHYSSKGSGSIFAGNTYASSACATNQQVEVTYQIRFETSS